jgi:hypothetical protein
MPTQRGSQIDAEVSIVCIMTGLIAFGMWSQA